MHHFLNWLKLKRGKLCGGDHDGKDGDGVELNEEDLARAWILNCT